MHVSAGRCCAGSGVVMKERASPDFLEELDESVRQWCRRPENASKFCAKCRWTRKAHGQPWSTACPEFVPKSGQK